MDALDYLDGLPEPTLFRQQLSESVDHWARRDKAIKRVMDVIMGDNPIHAPSSTPYKTEVMHTRYLLAVLNEKTARFLDVPKLAMVSRSETQKDRERASHVEKWMNQAFVSLDRNSGLSVWSAVVRDAIAFDLGVERIERSPSFWPDLVVSADDEKNRLMRRYNDPDEYEKEKDKYLRESGLPMRSVYVPAHQYYPIHEGPRAVQEFQVEYRNIRSILRNKLFDTSKLQGLELGSGKGISMDIPIVHYVNEKYHAYWAMIPSRSYSGNVLPKVTPGMKDIGEPVLLYSYEHGLPMSPYNVVAGRFGGWRGNDWFEGALIEALCDLSDDADTIMSQAATYNRGVGWPTPVTYLDPQIRGQDEGIPKAITIKEGQPISMWVTEKIDTLFKPESNPMFESLYDKTIGRIQELSGSTAVFGGREAGVDTGYHHQLQISQSEHLDEKVEQNLANGVVNRGRIMLEHVKALGEKVYVVPIEKDDRGRYFGKEVGISPDDLEQIPQMAAKVRSTSPMNVVANLRALSEATSYRPGHNEPLYDDLSAMERFMGEEAPEEIIRSRRVQKEQTKLLESGVLTQHITRKLNMQLVQEGVPEPGVNDAADADPALRGALNEMNAGGGAPAQMGGVDPSLLSNIEQGDEVSGMNRQGSGGGPTPGMPQPEQVFGRQAAAQQEFMRG